MKNLLSDRKVQLGLGAAVLLGVLWLFVGGGSDSVDEATTTETPVEVVAPGTVNEVISNTETTNTTPAESSEENTTETKPGTTAE